MIDKNQNANSCHYMITHVVVYSYSWRGVLIHVVVYIYSCHVETNSYRGKRLLIS